MAWRRTNDAEAALQLVHWWVITSQGMSLFIYALTPFSKRKISCRQMYLRYTWWRHPMETYSASLALCVGNSPVAGEFPPQRPVTRSFGVFFALRLKKPLSTQSRRRWFEIPSFSLWRHCNVKLEPVHFSDGFFGNALVDRQYEEQQTNLLMLFELPAELTMPREINSWNYYAKYTGYRVSFINGK